MTGTGIARLLATAAAVVVLLWAPTDASPAAAQTPAAGESTTWSIAPATADGPDGRVSLRHVLDPGTSVLDWVHVQNFGPLDGTFRIYPGAGIVGDSGAFDISAEPGDGAVVVSLEAPEGVAPDADGALTVQLAAEESVIVPVTIAAADNARPGDHPVGVVAELVPDGSSEVRLMSRVGVRAHLQVTGDLLAQVVAEDVQTRWAPSWNPLSPGTLHVDYVLHNSGNVRLGATPTVTAAGPFGWGSATAVADSMREILPGERHPVTTELSLWGLVRAGGEVRVEVAAVGEDQLDTELRAGQTPFSAWTLPWAQLLVVALVVLLVLGVRRNRRARAARVQREIDAALAAAGLTRAEGEVADAGDAAGAADDGDDAGAADDGDAGHAATAGANARRVSTT